MRICMYILVYIIFAYVLVPFSGVLLGVQISQQIDFFSLKSQVYCDFAKSRRVIQCSLNNAATFENFSGALLCRHDVDTRGVHTSDTTSHVRESDTHLHTHTHTHTRPHTITHSLSLTHTLSPFLSPSLSFSFSLPLSTKRCTHRAQCEHRGCRVGER